MSETFHSFNISEVVDLLGLERRSTQRAADSFEVCCPFCGTAGKFKCNINTTKNVYHCFRCNRSGGVLDLYGRLKYGDSFSTREVYLELSELLNESPQTPVRIAAQKKAEQYIEIEPADEPVLNDTYSALLSLPYLSLSDEHKKNLIDRGLTEDDIRRCQFATLDIKRFCDPSLKKIYDDDHLHDLKKKVPALSYTHRMDICFGMQIARDLLEHGHEVERVPGFFKLGTHWCFRIQGDGILIPTRNTQQKVVGMQLRLDQKKKDGLRYLTISSKGLDGGVTTNIAKTHFSYGTQAALSEKTTVYLTEGPLKAEVIRRAFLDHDKNDFVLIALQGVSSHRDLPMILEAELKANHIDTLHELFDMDKVVNPSVLSALSSVKKTCEKHGIKFKLHFWDEPYATQKRDTLLMICKEHEIETQKTDNIYRDLAVMSSTLTNSGIDYDYIYQDGVMIPDRWSGASKGFDDFCRSHLYSRPLIEG